MPVTFEEDDSGCTLHLEGMMEIGGALEVREQLLRALSLKRPIHVSLSQVNEIDITIMQLLWAATGEAVRSGSSISLDGPVSEQVRAALDTAGMANLLEIRS